MARKRKPFWWIPRSPRKTRRELLDEIDRLNRILSEHEREASMRAFARHQHEREASMRAFARRQAGEDTGPMEWVSAEDPALTVRVEWGSVEELARTVRVELIEQERQKRKERARKGGLAMALKSKAWKNELDASLHKLYKANPLLIGNARAAARKLKTSGTLTKLRVEESTARRYIETKNRLLKK